MNKQQIYRFCCSANNFIIFLCGTENKQETPSSLIGDSRKLTKSLIFLDKSTDMDDNIISLKISTFKKGDDDALSALVWQLQLSIEVG